MKIVAEEWKSAKEIGFSNYEVSDCGRVSNAKSGRILKLHTDRGYKCLRLPDDSGKRKNLSVHRMVAMLFIPGYEQGLDVNHKNSIRSDNRKCNLEWMTRRANVLHGIGRRIENCKLLTDDEVRMVRLARRRWVSFAFLARWFGVNSATVRGVCRRKKYNRKGVIQSV